MMSERAWVPVALARDIEPGTSAGTRIWGAEIVVWRDGDGAAHVWEDRCPHRGMRLSFGFVRADRLTCLYHGWQFDGAGRCQFIPAHPKLDVPATITATIYASFERAGIVWACDGEPGDEPHDDLRVTPVRSITVEAPIALIEAGLFSMPPSFPGGMHAAFERTGPLFAAAMGAERVLAALQALSATQTCIHIVLAGADQAEAGRLQSLSRWAETLRDAMEAGMAEAKMAEASAGAVS